MEYGLTEFKKMFCEGLRTHSFALNVTIMIYVGADIQIPTSIPPRHLTPCHPGHPIVVTAHQGKAGDSFSSEFLAQVCRVQSVL